MGWHCRCGLAAVFLLGVVWQPFFLELLRVLTGMASLLLFGGEQLLAMLCEAGSSW